MEKLVQAFINRENLTTDDILIKLRNTNFLTISAEDAIITLADLLLEEHKIDAGVFDFPPGTYFTDRMNRLKEKEIKHGLRILTTWFFLSPPSALYPFFLANQDFGKTRRILNSLFKPKNEPPPPYLHRVLHNILLAYFPIEQVSPLIANQRNIEMWAPVLNEMFATGRPVRRWLKTKDHSLRFYGGQTNTILDYYDPLCNGNRETGFDRINRDAEYYVDLGGGFNTPEMIRLSGGLPFISHDILAPTPTETLLFVRRTKNQGEILLSDAERQDYLDKLSKTNFSKFDVFVDHFPTDKQSYVIVSTGFLTSTVRANDPTNFGGFGYCATSLAGVRKIMELVQLGKDVDLFTVNRATVRPYSNKTVFVSFRKGRVVDLVTTIDQKVLTRFTNERKNANLSLLSDQSPFVRMLTARDKRWEFFPNEEDESCQE